MNNEKPYNEIENTWFASVIYRVSDSSRLSAWPLRILAICSFLCSGIIWYAKNDWTRYINEQDFDYLISLSRITDTASVVLGIILILTIIITILSLIFFIRIAFGNDFSKVIREANRDLLLNSFFFGVSLVFLLPSVSDIKHSADSVIKITEKKMRCARRMEKLGEALRHYAEANHHWYPDPNRWCDLLIKYGEAKKDDFVCPASGTDGCHYAINPNAVPMSRFENRSNYWDAYGPDPLNMKEKIDGKTREKLFQKEIDDMMLQRKIAPSVVLLFECETGWNQNGGAELLSTKHHEGKGCNILLNDGRLQFISTENFYKLRWGSEQITN
ncbi:MAG: hypothetical protein JW749_02440 [Sedimentisphaerales bacterium]|nr:hypothetical protein [Sedimentisphaerales bacterium]